jgi:hypothetical protein
MYNLDQVMTGLTKFIDNEIINSISGWQKWVVGTGLGIATTKGTHIFESLKQNELIKMLELIDENDNIDVDTIYEELLKQARRGPITIELPMVGNLTLKEQDVISLYNYIKN